MTIIRDLGKNEQILTNLNQLACTWNIVIVSRIRGLLDEKTLGQAFELVRQRHPILNCRIVKSSKNFYFESSQEMPKVPLRIIKDFGGNIWEEIAQQELNTKIDPQECLLRAVIVYPLEEQDVTYLIMSLHHAVADGQSSMQLHSEILTYCQQIVQGLPIILDTNDSLPILPPVESFLPKWTRGLTGLVISQLYLLYLVLQKNWHRPKTFEFEKYQPIELRRCKVIHRQLDPEITKALITLSRKENTTVHAALCAAMILTAARKMNEDNSKEICISCKSTVNLRKRLVTPICNNQMGPFASLLMSYLAVQASTSFWDLAREVKQQIEDSLRREEDFRMLLSSGFLFHYLLRFPRQVTSTVHISNVGRVTIPHVYGPFTLEEISFATANRFYGGIFTAEVTTFQEKMFLNFVFVEPLISQSAVEEFISDTISQIIEVCQGVFA